MALVSFDHRSNEPRSSFGKKVFNLTQPVIFKWLDTLKGDIDLVEKISVRLDDNGAFYYLIVDLVVLDPVEVYDGIIINKDRRPRLGGEFRIRFYGQDEIKQVVKALTDGLSRRFNSLLRDRAKMLEHNRKEIESVLKRCK